MIRQRLDRQRSVVTPLASLTSDPQRCSARQHRESAAVTKWNTSLKVKGRPHGKRCIFQGIRPDRELLSRKARAVRGHFFRSSPAVDRATFVMSRFFFTPPSDTSLRQGRVGGANRSDQRVSRAARIRAEA